MAAVLDNPPLLEHKDAVAQAGGAVAVADEQAGAALQQFVEMSVDLRLGARVEGRRRLVQVRLTASRGRCPPERPWPPCSSCPTGVA